MADPLSITASIVGITAAGVQVSISLFALAETVSTASERVSSIANDISSTCGILNQLRDLITPQAGFISAHNTSIFNPTALSDIHSALHHCRSIFTQIKKHLGRATKQISDVVTRPTLKITLSRAEKAKWPFLQASVQELRNDLRDSKTNPLLMVAVANLAMARRRGRVRVIDVEEQADLKAAIVKLQRMKTVDVEESDEESEEEKESLVKRLMQKLGLRRGGRKEESENDTDERIVQNDGDSRIPATGTRNVVMSDGSPERSRHLADATAVTPDSAPRHEANSRASESRRSESPVNVKKPLDNDRLHEKQLNKSEAASQIDKNESMKSGLNPAQNINTGIKDEAFPVIDLDDVIDSIAKDQDPGHNARFVDVAVQTVTEKEVVPNELPFMTPIRPDREGHVTATERFMTSKFPERIILDQSRSTKARGPPESAESSQLEPVDATRKEPSSVGSEETKEGYLQAWIFSILPGLTMGQGPSIGIMDLNLSEPEIRALLQKQEAQQSSPTMMLNQLNTYQSCAVLHHTRRSKSKLLYVDVWRKESMATVLGELEIVTLMWVTSSAKRIDSYAEAQIEEQNWNMARGDSKGKGIATSIAPAPPEPPAVEEPLYFKDAVGRKFIFPFQLVKAWKGMEELIKQAFLHVDVIGPHVQEGHYDLVDPDGKIILPQIWSHLVKPGWDIVMHMWPMPEPPPRPRPQPPPPPPPIVDVMPHRPVFTPAPPPPPPGHPYLRHSFDVKQNDMSVLKWMAGMAGPGLGKPSLGKRKAKEHEVPYRVVDRNRSFKKEEDRIVDDLLFKWTG